MILTNFVETFGTWIGICALFVSLVVWTAAALACLWGLVYAGCYAWEVGSMLWEEVRQWSRTR